MKSRTVYDGSDGQMTRDYYAKLESRGPIGIIAMNLFRAQKCSDRAKKYRFAAKGKYRDNAYDRKSWSMGNLCQALLKYPDVGISFGWKIDPGMPAVPWVLYIDLPNGQCSFHHLTRGQGPDYPGDWDRQRESEKRILAFCDSVFEKASHATQKHG